MFRYRDHRGGLAESMETMQEFDSLGSLNVYLKSILHKYCIDDLDVKNTTIKPYGFDKRIAWDSHIVQLEGWGVLGFTDRPVET